MELRPIITSPERWNLQCADGTFGGSRNRLPYMNLGDAAAIEHNRATGRIPCRGRRVGESRCRRNRHSGGTESKAEQYKPDFARTISQSNLPLIGAVGTAKR
jgi:hypothetical protein